MSAQKDLTTGSNRLLQWLLFVALSMLVAGGVLFLAHHGMTWPAPHAANQGDAALRSIPYALHPGSGRFWMELGLALLLWSPALRLCGLLWRFIRIGDWLYLSMTALLLALIIHSLLP